MKIQNKFKWIKDDDGNNVQVNGEDFRNTGLEVEYVRKINDNWKVNAGLMLANPENNDYGYWMQDSARVQGNVGVQFTKNKWNANLGLFVTAKREDSYYTLKGDTAKTKQTWDHTIKNMVLLNSTIQYNPDKNSNVTLTLNNILNNKYPINEYENWSMPFNWMLTYNHSF